MSSAWETTTEDVRTVLAKHGKNLDDPKLVEITDSLDHDAIESAALAAAASENIGDDLEKQTAGALSEIEDQLIEDGVIVGPTQFN